MELALAIVTALGSLFGIIMYVMKRRDDKKVERNKGLDEDKAKFHDAMAAGDDRTVNRMLDRLRRMRKK